jgi:hypothetical protein
MSNSNKMSYHDGLSKEEDPFNGAITGQSSARPVHLNKFATSTSGEFYSMQNPLMAKL